MARRTEMISEGERGGRRTHESSPEHDRDFPLYRYKSERALCIVRLESPTVSARNAVGRLRMETDELLELAVGSESGERQFSDEVDIGSSLIELTSSSCRSHRSECEERSRE